MKESGLSSTQSSKGKKGETLDDESRQGLERVKAKDAEIDNDLDEINAAIAGLGNIASQMRDEVIAVADMKEYRFCTYVMIICRTGGCPK